MWLYIASMQKLSCHIPFMKPNYFGDHYTISRNQTKQLDKI